MLNEHCSCLSTTLSTTLSSLLDDDTDDDGDGDDDVKTKTIFEFSGSSTTPISKTKSSIEMGPAKWWSSR